jgi:SAM-dependent methyltransferase
VASDPRHGEGGVKPAHLAASYAAQFADEEVAAAYRHRPPYPAEAFSFVEPLLGPRPRRVLELGAGTGDFTIGLAPRVESLIAVEPSHPMLERGRQRTDASLPHVEWIPVAGEDYAFDGRVSAVVSAEAFHWLDWHRVMPRIATALAPGGYLILVERRLASALPWERELRELITEYSTNRDYVEYDLVTELTSRGLFTVAGRAETDGVEHRQSVADYIESFHSRNGFSRARLTTAHAREFDEKLAGLLGPHCLDGTVGLRVQARLVWGWPG